MNFEQALILGGLLPRDIVADGRWRRCATTDHLKKKNGAYILHSDGRGYWRNWATDDGVNSWRQDGGYKARPIDEERLRKTRERDRIFRIQSMKLARKFWSNARPLNRPHPYIARKGLSALGCAGLRTHGEMLVIPVMLGEWLISVQTITPDGEKRFWTGAPVKAGAYYLKREKSVVTCVAEGLATGLAVYQSIRHASVIVAFDAGNLVPAVDRIKPSGSIVVAADNDWKTQDRRGVNPGLEKARNVADLIGCGVAYPQGIEGSDWSDYLNEVGEGAAKKLERLVLAQARYVTRQATGAIP